MVVQEEQNRTLIKNLKLQFSKGMDYQKQGPGRDFRRSRGADQWTYSKTFVCYNYLIWTSWTRKSRAEASSPKFLNLYWYLV